MNCTKCGGKLSSSDNFCKLCGAPAAVKIDLPPAEPSAETISQPESYKPSQTQYYPNPNTASDAETGDSGSVWPAEPVLKQPGLTPDSQPYADWPNTDSPQSTSADSINTSQNQFGSKPESFQPSKTPDYLNSESAAAAESSDSGLRPSEPAAKQPEPKAGQPSWPNTASAGSAPSEGINTYQNQFGSKPESFQPSQGQNAANPAGPQAQPGQTNPAAENAGRTNAYQSQFQRPAENNTPQQAQGYQNQYSPQQQGGGYAYGQGNYQPQQNQSRYTPPQYQQGAQNTGYNNQQPYQGYQQNSAYPPQQTVNIGNYQQQVSYSREADRPSIGLNILSFFFASVGLIIYLLIYSEKPVKARGIGIWSLIGFGVSAVLYVFVALMNL